MTTNDTGRPKSSTSRDFIRSPKRIRHPHQTVRSSKLVFEPSLAFVGKSKPRGTFSIAHDEQPVAVL